MESRPSGAARRPAVAKVGRNRPVSSPLSLVLAGALAAVISLGDAPARADLTPGPPPACTEGHRGDACEGAGAERGICEPVECDKRSPFWRAAKGATECLACVVPPDPPVNDPPATTGTATVSAPPPQASPAPAPRSRTVGRVLAIGTGLLVLGGLLALLRRRRRQDR